VFSFLLQGKVHMQQQQSTGRFLLQGELSWGWEFFTFCRLGQVWAGKQDLVT
jgi:hypothetical protein